MFKQYSRLMSTRKREGVKPQTADINSVKTKKNQKTDTENRR